MLTDEQINDHWREANRRDDSWMPQIHWRFARAIEAAAVAPLLERIAALETLSVTHIMTSINPGWDGMGEEVYAKSVSDVEDKLSKMGQELEEWQLGIKRHSEMEARIAELESQLAAAKQDAADADSMSKALADLDTKNHQRWTFLHTTNSDAEGFEWCVMRVKWENGRISEAWHTNSDMTDLDAAIARTKEQP